MVLIRILGVVTLIAGCDQSLFDNGGGTDGGSGSGDPLMCPGGCLANAAADFDGSPTGSTMHWRYLDDHRDRTWAAMTGTGPLVGADPANTITTCALHDAPACAALPGALLVSSSGATSGADPAIEFTAPTAQVIQLSLHAFVPAGSIDQTFRIYRNSREDVLFTGVATANATLDQAITVDALAGDRFLLAMAPMASGATDVALHFFVNATGAVFPASCQVAIPFTAGTMSGTKIKNECGAGDFTHYTTDTPSSPVLGAGPFLEAGESATVATDTYYDSMPVLDKNNDVTIQMWIKTRTVDTISAGFAFSDMDLNATGGLAIDVFFDGASNSPKLEMLTCTDAGNPLMFANAITSWSNDKAWRFVRVVHTGGNVNMCVDGKKATSFALPQGKLLSTFPPFIGRNVVWTPQGSFFNGDIDDVRVFTGALPCE